MPIDVQCRSCQKRYRLKDELHGKKFKCTECGEIVVVKASGTPAAPSAVQHENAPPRKKRAASAASGKSSPAPAPAKKRRPAKKKRSTARKRVRPDPFGDDYRDAPVDDPFGDLDDYRDDFEDPYSDQDYDDYSAPAPRRKKKKKPSGGKSSGKKKSSSGGGVPITFNLNRINGIMVVFGVIMIFWGIQELRLTSKSGSSPKQITLAELSANGPGNDVYFTVSGVSPASDGYVVTEIRPGKITEAWFACVPEGSGGTSNFVVYSADVDTESEVGTLMMTSTHTGMIINGIKGMDNETKSLLRQSFPSINPETAYVFQVGRNPAGFLKYGGLMLGGLVLLLAGLAWIFLIHH